LALNISTVLDSGHKGNKKRLHTGKKKYRFRKFVMGRREKGEGRGERGRGRDRKRGGRVGER
jgi:hypothetical protein